LLVALLLPGIFSQLIAQTPKKLIYGGDRDFPPYEYLDTQGRPQGFNVRLVEALSRETGIPVEIRLAPWSETMAALESGQVDFVSLAYSPERELRYDLLTPSWSLHQDLVFKGGRPSYPLSLEQLAGEIVAVEDRSVMDEIIRALPQRQRPVLRVIPNQTQGLELLLRGEVTAVGGNGLALRFGARQLGMEDIHAVAVKTLTYHFCTRKNNAAAILPFAEGIPRLHANGKFERLVEENLSAMPPERNWRKYALYLAILMAVLVALGLAGVIWTRSLRWQVQERTKELRQSQQAYESLIHSVDGIVWESDAQVNFTFVSAQAERRLGYPRAQWLEPGFIRRMVLPEDHPVLEECARQTALGRDHQTEFRVRTADERILWMQNYCSVLMEEGRPTKLRGVMVDVTERRQTEEALRLSEAQFRDLAETLSVGILIYRGEGHRGDQILFTNRAFQQISGYQGSDVKWDFVHPASLESVRRRVDARRSGEQVAGPHEAKIITKSGEERWIQTETGEALFEGAPAHVVTISDITERKRTEESLQHSNKLEAVGKLAGGVAHDFNNLLTVIKGYTTALRGEMGGISIAGAIREIDRAADRAIAVTRQLLAFSRRQVMQPTVLSLNEVVAGIDQLLRRLVGEDITLQVKAARDLGAVKADQGQIEQVLMNLLVNARDAMPNGGTVRIATANVEADELFVSQRQPMPPGSYVNLTITDTGEGMDAATQARVFEPFFTTKETGRGTGLGLSMVYGIVKQSGGYIWFTSEVGKGTKVEIYLPRLAATARQAMASDAVTAQPVLAGPCDETVLLAEDEDALRWLVEAFLVEQGYKVLCARAGEDAVVMAKSYPGPIHLLVTDIIMTGMNGHALAQTLLGERPEIGVLYVSGYADREIGNRIIEEGSDFLYKPFNRAGLLGKVRQILDRPRMRVANRHVAN
jgi:PAS domain S-box-containing protein